MKRIGHLGMSLAVICLLIFVSGSVTAKRVTITYYHGWTSHWEKVIKDICDIFNKSQDRITVKPVTISDDLTQRLIVTCAAGSPPDVMTLWGLNIPSLSERGILTPLDTLMVGSDRKILDKWFYPAAKKLSTYKGKLMSMPSTMNTYGFYYNKKLFREAGLNPNRGPQSIAELDIYCDKLNQFDAKGMVTRLGFRPDDIFQWGAVFGGDFYDEKTEKVTCNNPKIVAALDWIQSYREKIPTKIVSRFNGSLQNERAGAKEPFISGKFAMQLQGQWKVEDIRRFGKDMEFGTSPLPHPPIGKANAFWCNGNVQVIPLGSKHKKEAWEFLKFWSGIKYEKEAAKFYTWGGWVPNSPNIGELAVYREYYKDNPEFKIFLDLIRSENATLTPRVPVQQFFSDRVSFYEGQVKDLKMSARAGMDKANEEITKELQKFYGRLKRF